MCQDSNLPFRIGLLLVLSFTVGSVVLCGCTSDGQRENEGRSQSETTTDSSISDSSKRSVWYNFVIEGRHEGGYLTVTLNGFPVEESSGMIRYRESEVGLNAALVGRGNRLTLRSEPLLLRGREGVDVGDPGIVGWVQRGEEKVTGARISAAKIDSVYQAWTNRVQEQWKEYRAWEKEWLKKNPGRKDSITWKEGGALDSMRAWASRNPLVVTTTFDNEAGPDFSRVFEEAPRLEDTPATRKRLKDYAMQLRAVISNHDGSGLYRELRPSKNAEYQQQGMRPPSDSARRADWAAAAEKRVGWFQPGRSAGALRRDGIGLRKWVEGRVWELYKEKSGEPLFGESDIFVAEVEGELKVVRVE